jgi:hypothetical protein
MAAGATYEPIATQTLASTNISITFSSIAATYTDLRVVLNATVNIAAGNIWVNFNGDTASNYSQTVLNGGGSGSGNSARLTSQTKITLADQGNGTSSTINQMFTLDIFSYAGSTNKTLLSVDSQDENGSGNVSARVGLWRNTAAITSIALSATTGRLFNIGTTATLYGIKAA